MRCVDISLIGHKSGDSILFYINQFAENYAKKGLVRLREIFTPGTLRVPKTPTALKELESIHKVRFILFWVNITNPSLMSWLTHVLAPIEGVSFSLQ